MPKEPATAKGKHIELPEQTPEQLEKESDRFVSRFAKIHGKKYPRLLAAIRATEENINDETA